MARSTEPLRDRRVRDVAEAILEVLEAVFFCQLRAELYHLGSVIDRDDFARVFREQLRERPLTRAEIRDGERRQEGDHGVGQRLPRTARAMIAPETAGELIEILARLVLAFAQNDLERGPIALHLGHFASQRAGQFAHLRALRVQLRAVR